MQEEGQKSNVISVLYEAQASCGRYFVHEPTSEVNSRTRCVTRIMAMPGTRTLVADLCMIALAGCDEGGAGICQRERADRHQCTTSWNADAKDMRRHASACLCWCKRRKREDGVIRSMGT